MPLSERDVRANAAVCLFTVNGKEYKTPVLPMTKADEWLDMAQGITTLEALAQSARQKAGMPNASDEDRAKARQARQTLSNAMLECVCAYNPEALPVDALRDSVTSAQLAEALFTLKEATDPFDQIQLQSMKLAKAQLAGLPPGLIERGLSEIEKRSTSSP